MKHLVKGVVVDVVHFVLPDSLNHGFAGNELTLTINEELGQVIFLAGEMIGETDGADLFVITAG